MALRLILGNSGSGKSHHLYRQITEAAVRSPESNFLVIVPEQFTMQTQRDLVRMHPNHGLWNIDVLSFPRLAARVFAEVGEDARTVLEEVGKTLLLRRAAMKCQDSLKLLKNNLRAPGYLSQAKSILSELTQYQVDAEKMERLLASAKQPALRCKLEDIRTLYDAFQEELSDVYMTAEETLGLLAQVAGRSALLRGSVIALDGFTGFTPTQNAVLSELLAIAKEVRVTVTIGQDEDFGNIHGEHELFYLSKKTIRSLTRLAKERGAQVLPPTVLGGEALPRFAKNPALAHLEANLFRPGRRPVYRVNDKDVATRAQAEKTADTAMRAQAEKTADAAMRVQANGASDAATRIQTKDAADASGGDLGICLHLAENPMQEAHFCARAIRKFAKEGYRYQDMAVIVGDMASYCNYIPRVFRAYDIPCFMDSARTVFSNPLIEFLRAVLQLPQQNFSAEAVFRWLRAGLCRVEKDEVDRLENYVLASGVRGMARWSAPFTRVPDNFSQEDVAQMDALREKIWGLLAPFTEVAARKESTVREKTEVLYRLLCQCAIQEQLSASAQQFAAAGQPELEKEFAGIYATVIALFEKLVDLLGDETMPLAEYAQLLEAGFAEARLRLIPPAMDRVQVGDLERTRLNHVKILFFLGLNDGWVPSVKGAGGLLSDMEREALRESGVELAPTMRQNSYVQSFYLYQVLTKPSARLFLTCSRTASDGSSLHPSFVLRQVARLFPGLRLAPADQSLALSDRVETAQTGVDALVEGLREARETEPSPAFCELYNWYRKGAGKAGAEHLAEAAFLVFDDRGIGKEAARALYGETLANSVTRLERFAACAFSHFLQYGLRLLPRAEYVFRPVDLGRVLHAAIERYQQGLLEDGLDWGSVTEEEQIRRIDACVEETTRDYGQQILHDTARSEAVIGRIKRIMRRTVWALHRQVAAGRFVPKGFEVRFSQVERLKAASLAVAGGASMRLSGCIDRIDLCETEKEVYVKVLDYKSGSTSLDYTELYHGLQLQLMLYLAAAMEMEARAHPGKAVLPAGILYYHMADPLRKAERALGEDADARARLRALRPDGLVNRAPEIVEALDQGMPATSDVIPVRIGKDGQPMAGAHVATTEQFSLLSDFARGKMLELATRMMEGEIAPIPYLRKQRMPCDNCDYIGICQRDAKIPGTWARRIAEIAGKDIWEQLEAAQKTDGQGGDDAWNGQKNNGA